MFPESNVWCKPRHQVLKYDMSAVLGLSQGRVCGGGLGRVHQGRVQHGEASVLQRGHRAGKYQHGHSYGAHAAYHPTARPSTGCAKPARHPSSARNSPQGSLRTVLFQHIRQAFHQCDPQRLAPDRTSRSAAQENKRGLKVQCSHYKHCVVTSRDGRLPCVVYCHCNSGSRRDAEEVLYLLLPRGVTVFCMDFAVRGRGGVCLGSGWRVLMRHCTHLATHVWDPVQQFTTKASRIIRVPLQTWLAMGTV